MTATCESGVGLLMDYLEGVLPPDVSLVLERHVAGCRRCTAFVESYRQTPRILREATAATIPPGLIHLLHDLLRSQGEDPQ